MRCEKPRFWLVGLLIDLLILGIGLDLLRQAVPVNAHTLDAGLGLILVVQSLISLQAILPAEQRRRAMEGRLTSLETELAALREGER